MAGQKFINLSSGQLQEVVSAQVGGEGYENKIPSLDSTGRLAATMMPSGIGAETKEITASEILSAGNLVNIFNSSGTKCRKADCSNGRRAHGFVLAGVALGDPATVYLDGNITSLTGKTQGASQFLSTAGAMAEVPPITSTNIVQEIGYAVSDTEVTFDSQQPITLA